MGISCGTTKERNLTHTVVSVVHMDACSGPTQLSSWVVRGPINSPILHLVGRELRRQDVEALLQGDSFPAELVIRRETRRVRRLGRISLGVGFLEGVHAVASVVLIVHEIHLAAAGGKGKGGGV